MCKGLSMFIFNLHARLTLAPPSLPTCFTSECTGMGYSSQLIKRMEACDSKATAAVPGVYIVFSFHEMAFCSGRGFRVDASAE